MQNVFDNIATNAFGVAANLMGYDASWKPSNEDPIQTARVMYREPTMKERLAHTDYNPVHHIMEYVQPDFQGLYEAVNQSNIEVVEVAGQYYTVIDVERCWDGRTYKAKLEPKRNELQSY